MEKIKELCIKHREILVYLIVGVMTTVFAWAVRFLWNIVFYAGTAHPLPVQTTILTIVEFIAGVSFAYPTNRKWVFRSTNPNILKEAAGFVSARLTTLAIQMLLNLAIINLLHVNFYVATVVIGIIVVILNYVFSKLLVFRKKDAE
ncbi:MAG: GtrA family protein [Oscillospiraceae bacterium]|nr:GtrA family protein [Oscillospiraceae bacterium]